MAPNFVLCLFYVDGLYFGCFKMFGSIYCQLTNPLLRNLFQTMAARIIALGLRTVNHSTKRLIPLGAAGAHSASSPIGNREVVGYGFNGVSNYADRPDFPMPAVRFRETTPDVQVCIRIIKPSFAFIINLCF